MAKCDAVDHGVLNASANKLDEAFKIVCRQRHHFPKNADIWALRRQRSLRKAQLLTTINQGDYRFSPLQ